MKFKIEKFDGENKVDLRKFKLLTVMYTLVSLQYIDSNFASLCYKCGFISKFVLFIKIKRKYLSIKRKEIRQKQTLMVVALSDRYEQLPFFLLYLTIIEFRQQIYIYEAEDVYMCLSVCVYYLSTSIFLDRFRRNCIHIWQIYQGRSRPTINLQNPRIQQKNR